MVARLRPGVSLSEAQQDIETISTDLSREFPATNRDHILHIGLLRDRMLGNAKDALWILMAAAVMFLLIVVQTSQTSCWRVGLSAIGRLRFEWP